jgi:hypothetical protein
MEPPVKRTVMVLYNERKKNHKCVRCGATHDKSWTLRKCQKCRTNESAYRKRTRSKRCAGVEQLYQRKNWSNRCVYLSKHADKVRERTSDEPYITPQRLKTLRVLQRNQCLYCGTTLQTANRKQPDGLTIDRLDNAKPHTLSNCVLACHRCNCRHKNKTLTLSPAEIFMRIISRFEQSDGFTQFYQNQNYS